MIDPSLAALLAHEPPMLLLDTLVSVDADGSCCEVTVTEDMPFFDSRSGLPGWVGIEMMAQTIAVWGGWQSKNEGRGVNLGLLLGSRKYESEVESFAKDSRLTIDARKVVRDGNLGVFQCTISTRNAIVATAQVNTYLPDEDELNVILARQF